MRRRFFEGFRVALCAVFSLFIVSSCSNNEDNFVDESLYSVGGKANISFAIPHSISSSTRLSANETQANNSFNGIKNIKFIAVNQGNASTAQADGNASYISTVTSISSISGPMNATNFDDVDGTNSGVKIYRNVQFPAVNYTLARYLFYGESNYGTAAGALSMTDVSAWTTTNKVSDLRFTLIDIAAPATLTAVANLIVNVMNEVDTYVATYSALQQMKDSLTDSRVSQTGSREHPISEYGLEMLLAYIYSQYSACGMDATGLASLSALNALGTYGYDATTQAYYCNLNATYANFLGDYPKGQYFLQLGYNSTTNVNSASFSSRTDQLYDNAADNKIFKAAYCKPASLWYYGNGYLVPQKTVSGLSSYDTQNWTASTYNNVYQGTSVSGIANPAIESNLAYSHTIQYGVAMAKSSINMAGAQYAQAHYRNGAYTLGTPQLASNGDFVLTGILFSSQRKQSDYKFDPITDDNTNSPKVTVYDNTLVGEAAVNVAGVGKSISCNGVSLNRSANDNLCYTLLLPSRKVDGTTVTNDSINVALELVNNTGKTIIGKNTNPQEPIHPGATFYIVGKMLYNSITSHTANVNRIFQSDYVTNLAMTIGDMSTANLYTTVPDLTNVVNTIALHIDITWTNGDTYGMNMGL